MAKKDFTIFDLMERFPDEESCIRYLSDQKWASGYYCFKCGSTKSKQGKKNTINVVNPVVIMNHQLLILCFIR